VTKSTLAEALRSITLQPDLLRHRNVLSLQHMHCEHSQETAGYMVIFGYNYIHVFGFGNDLECHVQFAEHLVVLQIH
jgi:hypothetical protein